MDNQIKSNQLVICEFCGVSVRYDRLYQHVLKVHQNRPLTKPIVVSSVVFHPHSKKRRSRWRTPLAVKSFGKPPVKHVIAVPVDKLKKCPHGVPEIQTCAICEPDKWRMENGY